MTVLKKKKTAGAAPASSSSKAGAAKRGKSGTGNRDTSKAAAGKNRITDIRLIAFTDRGKKLADRIAKGLERSQGAAGSVRAAASRCGSQERPGSGPSLAAWTDRGFAEADALVYVGACGIAVRAAAPHVTRKDRDPAIVVVDEKANFAISLLSGHLGGANDLTRKIAKITGATAVITTATDVNERFAVDEWAKRQNAAVLEVPKIKLVSGALLAGKNVTVRSAWDIEGEIPRGLVVTTEEESDVALDIRVRGEKPLHLVPRIAALGIGCRKGAKEEDIENAFREFLAGCGVAEEAIFCVASIDIKKEEPGLLAFCKKHGWPFQTYAAEQLREAPGSFTPSDFVRDVTGVDNVCERSAVLAAEGGALTVRKTAGSGVTFALAEAPFAPDWNWKA